jgi:hypothetical protein
VIRHGAGQEDLDLAAQCGFDQAVRERVVGLPIRSQQVLPLGASAGDHVELAREDLARQHVFHDYQELGQLSAV